MPEKVYVVIIFFRSMPYFFMRFQMVTRFMPRIRYVVLYCFKKEMDTSHLNVNPNSANAEFFKLDTNLFST